MLPEGLHYESSHAFEYDAIMYWELISNVKYWWIAVGKPFQIAFLSLGLRYKLSLSGIPYAGGLV